MYASSLPVHHRATTQLTAVMLQNDRNHSSEHELQRSHCHARSCCRCPAADRCDSNGCVSALPLVCIDYILQTRLTSFFPVSTTPLLRRSAFIIGFQTLGTLVNSVTPSSSDLRTRGNPPTTARRAKGHASPWRRRSEGKSAAYFVLLSSSGVAADPHVHERTLMPRLSVG